MYMCSILSILSTQKGRQAGASHQTVRQIEFLLTSFTGVTYSLMRTRNTKSRSSEDWRCQRVCVGREGDR